MMKSKEMADPLSCLNMARDEEIVFVLRAKDITAPDTIRWWVAQRIMVHKNNRLDPQIIEALQCADNMEAQRKTGKVWDQPESARRPDTQPGEVVALSSRLLDMRARWIALIEELNYGDQFDGDIDLLEEAASVLKAAPSGRAG